MVKLNITKVLEKEINKLSELEGYNNIEDYIVEKLVLLVVNDITFSDVENTRKKITILQEELNKKRNEILAELREEGSNK